MGIRNALIGDFNSVKVRDDLGALWENFLILERLKFYANRGDSLRYYFWRSYGGAEVDYLEIPSAQALRAFEIKYGDERPSKGAASFVKAYGVPVNVISKNNYLNFICQ